MLIPSTPHKAAELTADDATLATGMRPSVYARVLFELACLPEQPVPLGAVVPLLTPGGLKARVRALLEPGRPRRSRRGMALLLGLGAAGTVLPLAAASTRPPGRAGALLMIGRLVDAEKRPIAGAEVSFRPDRMGWNGDLPWNRTVLSDADGWFQFPGGAPWQVLFDVFARKGPLAARKGIAAVRFGTILPTTLELRRGLTLSGTVRDDSGRALSGARVRILNDRHDAPGPGPQVLATSDREGRWRIEGMLYGDYQLMVQGPSGVATTLTTRVAERDVSGLDVVLPREWPVTGWLQDEQGRRLPKTRIEHFYFARSFYGGRSGWPTTRFSLTDGKRHIDWDETAEDGSFRMLPRGLDILVPARDAEGHELFGFFHDGGQPFSGRLAYAVSSKGVAPPRNAPIVVTLVRNARVSGIVRASVGHPVPGAQLLVTQILAPGRASHPRPL